MLATIPFSGFYNSSHEYEIESTIEQMFTDPETGCYSNDGLVMALHKGCIYKDVFIAYAKYYAKAFSEKFNIPLEFESLESPREYNFTTDVIYCTVELKDMVELLGKVDLDAFAEVAKELFTSRSGFASFYDPDINAWGNIAGWDHNQLGALLQAYARQETGDFNSEEELFLMEHAQGNGYIDQWIEKATPSIERLYKIHEYLEIRASR